MQVTVDTILPIDIIYPYEQVTDCYVRKWMRQNDIKVDVEATVSIHLITKAGKAATVPAYNISGIILFCITL